ncbi:MAG: redoxin domain-containing protein [Bacteroidales bacterium]|jgi:peroxiredoxin|nr:redoxin domain-containing protein [Bacteroidales bacterium]
MSVDIVKKIVVLCCVVLCCATNVVCAQQTQCTIQGNAADCANQTITVYAYSDYFSKLEEKITSFKVDAQGNFSASFPCADVREIFMYLGVYKCFVYAVPGKTIELMMPQRIEKDLADEFNPYFHYEDLSIGVLNDSDGGLNEHLLDFTTQFSTFVENNFQVLYQLREKSYVDTLEYRLDSIFAPYKDNVFFENYKNYEFNRLRYMVYMRDAFAVTHRYYLNKPVLYNNAPYMDLFRQMWRNYILHNHMKGLGKDMKTAIIYGKSPHMFSEVMEKNIAFRNDTLKELLLLQCLDDCFKMPEIFPPATVMQTLDSLILITNVPEHKQMAQNIVRKRTVLPIGDTITDFLLANYDSLLFNLDKFRGKYVYINYCRSENYACIQDYRVLQEMNKKTKRDLHIVTLSAEKDFETFREFKTANPQYNWTFLYVTDHPEVLQAYKLKAMPSYMLIDPDGKLVLSSAPTPLDNFQQKFADIIIEKRKKDAENKKQQQKYKMW